MIKRIILDLDDVLNSLTMHILQHFGCNVGPFDYDLFPTDVGYDIIKACEVLGGSVPYKKTDSTYVPDVASFWNNVTAANLWRTAPKSPQCDWLLNECIDIVGRDEVYIGTTPTKDPTSYGEKVHWIESNLPLWIHRQHAITPRKWCMGKPGVVLFDDHLDNCKNFESDLNNGGKSFLVPRPWNPDHSKNTNSTLIKYLEEIC